MGSQKLVMSYLSLSEVSLLLPGEEQIPFMPMTIFIYIIQWVLPISVFMMITKKQRIMKILVAFLITILIHNMFFLIFPVEYSLRPVFSMDSTIAVLVGYLYQMDAPINTFPSMHVSFVFLIYFIIKRYRPQFKWTFLFLAVAISISTVLVKQHYILDVGAGFILAYLVNYVWISRKYEAFDKFIEP